MAQEYSGTSAQEHLETFSDMHRDPCQQYLATLNEFSGRSVTVELVFGDHLYIADHIFMPRKVFNTFYTTLEDHPLRLNPRQPPDRFSTCFGRPLFQRKSHF